MEAHPPRVRPLAVYSCREELSLVVWLAAIGVFPDCDVAATRGEHVQEVERVLRGGGGADVVYHCAEAGWFSLWEMAKALELGKAQQFLLAVAGSFDDLHV